MPDLVQKHVGFRPVAYIRRLFSGLSRNGLHKPIAELSIALGAIHILVGGLLTLDPDSFEGVATYSLVSFLPFRAWGIMYLITGGTLLVAGIKRKSNLARLGLTAYMVGQWLWALSFIFSINHSDVGFINFLQWMTGPVVGYLVLRRSVGGEQDRT